MSYAVSGSDGKVTSNTVDLDVKGYSVEVDSAEIDVMTTADLGWDDVIDGPITAKGTFDFFWNPSKNPFGSVLGLMPGAPLLGGSYPTLKLRLDSGNFIQGPAKISKLSLKSEVKGAKMFTCSFRNKGPWTVPTS